MWPNSPNTKYLHGDVLGDFIIEYCARNKIHCDGWIFNLEFGPYEAYSENAAISKIEHVAEKWHLRNLPPCIQDRSNIFNA